MKKLLTSIFVLLLAASLIGGSLVGCSSKTTSTTSTTSTTTPLTEATVLIGVTTPLTGGAAPWGISMKQGVEMAFADFNSTGGLTVGNTHYTFKVEALDDKYDPNTSTNAIRQLVYSEGAQFLFVFESSSLLAMASTLAQQKVLQFTVVYDDAILNPANTYTFRTVIPPSMKVTSFYKWLVSQYPGSKTMAHLSMNNISGTSMTEEELTAAKAAGLTVTDEIYYDAGTTDFTPFLTRILNKNPDILSLGACQVGDTALIVKTARGLGYKGVINNMSPVGAADMVPIAGNDAMEGFISTNTAMGAPLVSQTFIDLANREKSTYGTAYGNTWDFYSQATQMVEAMQRAKSVDPTVIKNILEDSTQVWPYNMFVGGKATFGTSVAKTLYGNAGYLNQIVNPYTVSIIKKGVDTNAAVVNP